MHGTTALETWLEPANMDTYLAEVIIKYVRAWDLVTMSEAIHEAPRRFWQLGHSQDLIRLCHFLEGMVSKKIISLQRQYLTVSGSGLSIEKWISGLITGLIEITHRQCIYRNFMVHDLISVIIATARKEELHVEIEQQRELGDEGLLEEDKYLTEVNMEDMTCTLGGRQHYWLLAIKIARGAKILWEQRVQHRPQATWDHRGEGI